MADIIHIAVARDRRDESAEAAWRRFADLSQKSKETLTLEDGLAAGRAYREFLELYARVGK